MKRLDEGGFLAAEVAVLAFLLLFAVASLAALERSAALLEHSEAETSAMFLAEGALARMEQQARTQGSGASLGERQPYEAEANGRNFTLTPKFSASGVSPSVCQASVRVTWLEKGEVQELSLERTVHLGGGR